MLDINIKEEKWHSCSHSITLFIENIISNILKIQEEKISILLINDHRISILLTNDDEIQEINKNFRNRNKPTNVLSFPYQDFPDGTIGDVILAFETIEKEAKEANISFQEHAAHMLIHGVLHLLGYSHDHDDDAEIMEALEDDILSKLSFL